MDTTAKLIIIYLAVMGVITFLLYGIDKYKAVRHKWRIPEKTLLGMCMIGGVIGGWAGMYIFRHKTKHIHFHIVQFIASVLWAVILGIVIIKL